MNQANFWFMGELNYFLPVDRKNSNSTQAFNGNPSIKHLIEAQGIPHTEVSRILVNGKAVDLSYLVQDGDQIEVYPVTTGSGGNEINAQRQEGAEARFILDNHLGRLASYLRMLGFDTLYSNDYQDEELAQVASQNERILLTRDRHLLMRSIIRHGYCVRMDHPRDQLAEVVQRFDLYNQFRPFQRCLHCNYLLQEVSKESVLPRLEPLTRLYYNQFHICPNCNRIYWRGSHFIRMQRIIEGLNKKHKSPQI